MEHRTEEGNPLLKLWSSIITHPKHWYVIMIQQIKQSTSSVYMTQIGVIKHKRKRKKRCKLQIACEWWGL